MAAAPISIRSAHDRVGTAIREASSRTGVDFSYLFNQARIESGLNPTAQATTSSARGLFQFIDQSWLATVNRHGANHGLGWASNAIQRTSGGRYTVNDPQLRSRIMALRDNPEAAASMAGEFAADNRDHLERELGRPAAAVDLYLAHFLGAGGAGRFLRAYDVNPAAAAAPLLPAAARANRSIFYDRSGQPRSLGEIRARFAERLGAGADTAYTASVTTSDPRAQTQSAIPDIWQPVPSDQLMAAPSPSMARVAYLLLASMGTQL